MNRITLPTEFHATCHLLFFQCRIWSFSTSRIFASYATLIWLHAGWKMKSTYTSSLESNRKIASRFTLGLQRQAWCFSVVFLPLSLPAFSWNDARKCYRGNVTEETIPCRGNDTLSDNDVSCRFFTNALLILSLCSRYQITKIYCTFTCFLRDFNTHQPWATTTTTQPPQSVCNTTIALQS
jgi:hypothetical protein